jgi:hypothetical protein
MSKNEYKICYTTFKTKTQITFFIKLINDDDLAHGPLHLLIVAKKTNMEHISEDILEHDKNTLGKGTVNFGTYGCSTYYTFISTRAQRKEMEGHLKATQSPSGVGM